MKEQRRLLLEEEKKRKENGESEREGRGCPRLTFLATPLHLL